MSKGLKIILLLMSVFILCSCSSENDDPIRIRVIANSNEQTDQQYKMEVTQALLKILDSRSTKWEFDEDTIQWIEKELKTSVSQNKELKVEFKRMTFPAKSYKNRFLPSGSYQTLLVTIGSGKGKNWWSVLYPEYFGLSLEERMSFEDVEYRSYIYDHFFRDEEEDNVK